MSDHARLDFSSPGSQLGGSAAVGAGNLASAAAANSSLQGSPSSPCSRPAAETPPPEPTAAGSSFDLIANRSSAFLMRALIPTSENAIQAKPSSSDISKSTVAGA